MNLKPLLFLFIGISIFALASCKKDKLEGELEPIIGRYTWIFTVSKTDWWSSDTEFHDASESDYEAEIEFSNDGNVLFYIDEKRIHKTKFKIVDQYISENGETMTVEIDPIYEDTKKLDLNNTITVSLTSDTLYVDDYPGASYDESVSGWNYFIKN